MEHGWTAFTAAANDEINEAMEQAISQGRAVEHAPITHTWRGGRTEYVPGGPEEMAWGQ